jgi:hypothetical protein
MHRHPRRSGDIMGGEFRAVFQKDAGWKSGVDHAHEFGDRPVEAGDSRQ